MESQTRPSEGFTSQDYVINGVSLNKVRNKYEIIVINAMKKVLPEFPDFDNCPICLEDVYALSLSRIPSTYVSNIQYLESDAIDEENTEEIVRYAIFSVMSSPKHKV